MKSLILTLLFTFSSALAATPVWQTLPEEQPLPASLRTARVAHDGASIWYAVAGTGSPVILLHGGRASALTWGNQVPALLASHHQVILIDSRGHGHSTLGSQPLSYELMESDVIAVMDRLRLRQAAVVGWSDGAIISLIMAMQHPERVSRVYAFGANMDAAAVGQPAPSPILPLVGPRLQAQYERVAQPADFARLTDAVRTMQKNEPHYSDAQLAAIHGPRIVIAGGDHDEFLGAAYFAHLAATIPGAQLLMLRDVSHFAPWQDPAAFNASVLHFLAP
ncbi:pimeloyl-ACP methyl ester carboxylesterase [Duganella sp. 1224]|uniref:alpha/beta fold hydrolase n=1 Tax=Duganella sp. 1224 TaxID=2587052 RepID=UPI0015CE009B|nr:alpha/beta hydrolase [Duganella sp. 1224]NYE63401.1 pimeloyl-ACP methyl ester carboxylesterase [Duganella sp. 1224]